MKLNHTVKRVTGSILLAVSSSFLLTGCVIGVFTTGAAAEKTPSGSPTQVATTPQALGKKVVTTMCSLSGRSVITQEDIDSFRSLAGEIRSYQGENPEKNTLAADQLDTVADTYSLTLGTDLGSNVAQQHTQACDKLTETYNANYSNEMEG